MPNETLRDRITNLVKYLFGTAAGTVVDTGVLWLCSTFVFSSYIGRCIVSPSISFECAVFVNYCVGFFYIWRDRIGQRTGSELLRRFWKYNLSCFGAFIIKMAILLLVEMISGFPVFICNLLALSISGIFNFVMNEFVIFKRKQKDVA